MVPAPVLHARSQGCELLETVDTGLALQSRKRTPTTLATLLDPAKREKVKNPALGGKNAGVNDYTQWDEEKRAVASLLLDPQNPRIPPSDKPLGQRELIAELVEHDHVYDLARDIVSDGWSPLELMIALEEEDKTYILEGNRRLCALKLLRNAELAPANWQRKFKGIMEAPGATPPEKVRVLLAPGREDAAPLIMQKHTRAQVEAWDPLMKARFYRSLAETGLTVEQLAKQYGGKASDIADMLRLDEMYTVACRLELPKEVAEVVRNPRAFKATHLERILGFATARQLLGVEYAEDGKVRGKGNQATFVKAYSQIISDIAMNEIDSRTINKAEEAEQYVRKVLGSAPPNNKGGVFNMEDVLTTSKRPAAPSPASEAARTIKPKQKQKQKQTTVIPRGYKCGVSDRRTREVFDELRRLKVEEFPNAAAVMLRILLELSVDRYMHKTGALDALVKKFREKDPNKRKDWSPSLEQMLNDLVNSPTFRSHPGALKLLNKMVSEKHPQVGDLHSFVHNSYSAPSPSQLISFWEIFEPLFEVVLNEPVAPPSTGGTAKLPKAGE